MAIDTPVHQQTGPGSGEPGAAPPPKPPKPWWRHPAVHTGVLGAVVGYLVGHWLGNFLGSGYQQLPL